MSYGIGTRSYNASTEARENKRQQREATDRYLAQPRREIVLVGFWLRCQGSCGRLWFWWGDRRVPELCQQCQWGNDGAE
jgi:hypothetical protein